MLKLGLSFLLLLQAGNVAARLDIRAHGESVSVDARAVPLWQILDRLAKQTGMQVIYEGPKPTAVVTTAFETSSATDLLIRLMEGQGLNYAFQTDATGRKVQRLLVGEAMAGPTAAAKTRDGTPAAPAPPPHPVAEIISNDEDTSDFGNAENDTLPMTSTMPVLPTDSAVSAGVQGSAATPAAPQFPSGASFVSPLGVMAPTFPGAASMPIPGHAPPVPFSTPPPFPQGASEPVHR